MWDKIIPAHSRPDTIGCLVFLLALMPGFATAQRLEIQDLSNHTLYKFHVDDTLTYMRKGDNGMTRAVVSDFLPGGIVFDMNDTVAWSAIQGIYAGKRFQDDRTKRILTIALPVSVMLSIPLVALSSNRVGAELRALGEAKTFQLLVAGSVLAAGGLAVLGFQAFRNYRHRQMEERKPDFHFCDKSYRYKWRIKGKPNFDVT